MDDWKLVGASIGGAIVGFGLGFVASAYGTTKHMERKGITPTMIENHLQVMDDVDDITTMITIKNEFIEWVKLSVRPTFTLEDWDNWVTEMFEKQKYIALASRKLDEFKEDKKEEK